MIHKNKYILKAIVISYSICLLSVNNVPGIQQSVRNIIVHTRAHTHCELSYVVMLLSSLNK